MIITQAPNPIMSHPLPEFPRPTIENAANSTDRPDQTNEESFSSYTPDVEGTKAEADAKIARRAKIVFIILDILNY